MGILGVIELFLGFIALASPWIVGASFIWVIGIMLMVLAVVRLIQNLNRVKTCCIVSTYRAADNHKLVCVCHMYAECCFCCKHKWSDIK